MNKTGPTINRGGSKQDWATPDNFLDAVRKRFGRLSFDLAADETNAVTPDFCTKEQNSLAQPWYLLDGLLWLNPPFEDIEPWVEKCANEAGLGARILLLVPAAVGSNWYRNFVEPYAYVLGINPRLKFKGAKDAYPKDCVLACYMHGLTGFKTWRWK